MAALKLWGSSASGRFNTLPLTGWTPPSQSAIEPVGIVQRAPQRPSIGAPDESVFMSKLLIAPAVAVCLLVAPAATAQANRDLPRPSRSEAPARFGSIAYSQWYAKEASAIRYGWGPKQYRALKTLWFHESSWNHKAVNPSSGAWGIPQSLPARKMRTHGSDYKTNPETQIDWGLDYIKDRYGSPVKAWAFWQRHHWY